MARRQEVRDPRAGEKTTVETLARQAGLKGSESRVFLLYAEGFTVDQIAARLGLAAHSVECYASRARRKLFARFSTEVMIDEALAEIEDRAARG